MSRVLVVDDTPSELEHICRILQDAGIQVTRAVDGDEALTRIEESLPDLIVLDVVMPKMSGFEVLRELRGDSKNKKVPVVLCTQKNTEIDQSWGMDLGADAYVVKPFQAEQLLSIVRRFL